jgi:hypothetical protein
MIHGLQKEVMPHVRFENKDYGRDEEASLKAGRHIPKNAVFIIITSHGSKDSAEQIAEEWLPRKRIEASRGNYNIEWVEHFEKQFKLWKEGHELPRNGTPIATWQMISAEQNSRLRAMGITVVEDLAAVPDSGLAEYGLDARYMRDLARAWIAEGQQKGINAQELAQAQLTLRAQQEKIEDQSSVIRDLQERLGRLENKKRKPAEEAA